MQTAVNGQCPPQIDTASRLHSWLCSGSHSDPAEV